MVYCVVFFSGRVSPTRYDKYFVSDVMVVVAAGCFLCARGVRLIHRQRAGKSRPFSREKQKAGCRDTFSTYHLPVIIDVVVDVVGLLF